MNKTVLVYRFSDKYIPDLSEVGGKGLSLIKGSKSDLPVPPGFVLTVEFFKSWFDLLKNTKNWDSFAHIYIVLTIEKKIKKKFSLNEISKIETLGDCLKLYNKYKK